MSHRTPEITCLNCGARVDGATEVTGGRAPRPGDATICFYCHHLAIYGEDFQLRPLNDREVIELAGDPDILLAMRMLGKKRKMPQ
jgi:hypothetical protein